MNLKSDRDTYKNNWFGTLFIIAMVIVFIMNILISDYNLLWVLLAGGGDIIDFLGVSYQTILSKQQLYRLLTYGLTHTAIWHLCFNAVAMWYLSRYLERKVGTLRFAIVLIVGLIVSGVGIIFVFDGFQYGVSPSIFTWLGVLLICGIKDKDLLQEYKEQKGFRYLVGYLLLSNVIGIPTLVFHLIGFLTGVLIGSLFSVLSQK